MRKIEVEGGAPILTWCDKPEEAAIQQASNVAKLPFLHSRFCLMPDTHLGIRKEPLSGRTWFLTNHRSANHRLQP